MCTRRCWPGPALIAMAACAGPQPLAGGGETTATDASSGAPVSTVSTVSTEATTPLPGSSEASGLDNTDAPAATESGGSVGSGPPYPIVLAHGFFGFDDFAGAGFANYYFDVRDDLASAGEDEVFTPAVDPFNNSTVRGMQLLAHVEQIVVDTGAARINLVGHSQGGLDARVVAHVRPDLVASITTIATPHFGTPIADIVLGIVPDPAAQALGDDLLRLLGGGVWSELEPSSSIFVALEQLSTPGMTAFNATYTDAPGVAYRSIAGRSSLLDGGRACAAAVAPNFISAFDGDRDAIDPGLALSATILAGDALAPQRSDGLVRVLDARWGTFLGCVPADHLDEVGQLLGDDPGLGNAWRHLVFFRALVADLRAAGF